MNNETNKKLKEDDLGELVPVLRHPFSKGSHVIHTKTGHRYGVVRLGGNAGFYPLEIKRHENAVTLSYEDIPVSLMGDPTTYGILGYITKENLKVLEEGGDEICVSKAVFDSRPIPKGVKPDFTDIFTELGIR